MTEAPLFEPEKNCWRVERARRVAVIIDAADYFAALREALIGARRCIYLVGWDFDLRIEMLPGRSDEDGLAPDGYPNVLGEFIAEIAKRNPDLNIYVLKWSAMVVSASGNQIPERISMEFKAGRQISYTRDNKHPVGACHHSKIVVVDDVMAFCGGIDATDDRWDTRDHEPGDERRHRPDGSPFGPWHDCTTALEGDVAAALGDLARKRWKRASSREIVTPPAGLPSPWPDGLEADMRDVDVAIARTAPPYDGRELVDEIEQLYLDAIAAARKTIYLESQYFACGSICEALKDRLREGDGPELVVINPRSAKSFMEDESMHSVRALMMEEMRRSGGPDRFRILHPVNAAGTPIYVHAKVLIIDDRILRVGSSNIDNRSMGFDTECDVAIDAQGDDEVSRTILNLRADLLAEHMDRSPEEVAQAIEREGSVVAAIDALNPTQGRRLCTIEAEPLDPLEHALVETRLFDPRYRSEGDRQNSRTSQQRRSPALLTVGMAVGAIALAAGLWLTMGRSRRRSGRF